MHADLIARDLSGRWFQLACACATALAVWGCVPATVKQAAPGYQGPTSGPSARLLVRVSHPGGRYSVSNFDQPVACTHRREFVSATALEPASATFELVANKLQTLSFLHVRPDRKGCEVIVSFEPRAGNSYLMRNTANAEGCRVELFNTTNADGAVVERTRIRRERIGMGLADNACKPLTSTVPRTGQSAAPDASGEGRPDALEPFLDLLPRR
jgi:hypothetical protein